MMNNTAAQGSARLRPKAPVYTSDKRAKYTQRENKNWIRFCTVVGYIFFVSLPAASLSIYYIWIWDPDYISKFPPETDNITAPDSGSERMSDELSEQKQFGNGRLSATLTILDSVLPKADNNPDDIRLTSGSKKQAV